MGVYNFKENSLELLRLESRIRKLKRYKEQPKLVKGEFLVGSITPFTGLIIGIVIYIVCRFGNDYAYQNLDGVLRYIIAVPTMIGSYMCWIFIIMGGLFLFGHWDQVRENWTVFLQCDTINAQNARENQQNAVELSEALAKQASLQAKLQQELQNARETRSEEFEGLKFFFELPFDPLESTASLNDNISNRPSIYHNFLFGIPNLHKENGVARFDGMLQNFEIGWSHFQSYLDEDKYILLYLDSDYILEHQNDAPYIINPIYDVTAQSVCEGEYTASSIDVRKTLEQFNQSVDQIELELLGVSVLGAEMMGDLSDTDAARLKKTRKSGEQYLKDRLEAAATSKRTATVLIGEKLLLYKRCYVVERDGRIVCIAIPKEVHFFAIEYNLDTPLYNENAIAPTEALGRYKGTVSAAMNILEDVPYNDIPHTMQFITDYLNHMLTPFTPFEQPPEGLDPRMWRWWITLRYCAAYEKK